jgi:hypothetical protein
MTEYTYEITGTITYNQAETEDGFKTVEIDETITIDVMSAEKAFETFLSQNEQYDFFGTLKTCDAETMGCNGATFRDSNEGQTIDIELITQTPQA